MKFLKLGLFAAAASAALIISASAAGNTNLNGGTVTAQSSLNLRAEASTSSELLGSATSGSKLIVVSDTGDGWYEVNYNGKSGYMYSSYIQLGAVESDFGIGCVCGDTVNVRASAGTDSAVVAQFDNGKVLNITGVSGEWYKISDGSVSGYIRSDYISLTLGKGTVNGNNVRMRSEANTESEIITHYNYGRFTRT